MNPILIIGAAVLVVAAITFGVLYLQRSRVKSTSLQDALDVIGVDAAAAQANTREDLRRLAEDAGVKGELTASGWRPVRFETQAVEPAPQVAPSPEAAPSQEVEITIDEAPESSAIPPAQWIRVGQVFSPAAPINQQNLFAGRHAQMEQLIDVAFERGQHAIIFGERGVGKTSLATVMTMVFGSRATKLAVKVNCDATDTYATIWRKIFEEFDFVASASQALGKEPSQRLRNIIANIERDTPIDPNEVRKVLRLVTSVKECVIFIDEFERLRDRQTRALFADTLKMLSDQQVPATVVIVGVADDIQELLSEHRSIERALVQVHMPRMSRVELQEIVRRALELVDMKIEDRALGLITAISQGLPHFTHLIAQGAARAVIDEGEQNITSEHVTSALGTLVEKSQETIVEAYNTATYSHRETLYPQVLLAAAMAKADEHGFFAAADLVIPLSRVARRPYDIPAFSRHLHALAAKDRGPTLLRKGSEHRYRFRFLNPLLQPHVLMRGLATGAIKPVDLEKVV